MTRHPELDCAACGFEYDEADAPSAAAAIRDGVDELAAALVARSPAAVATRPSADVWSPLEYGCHVRDVLLVQRERLLLALVAPPGEPPSLAPMSRDERVELEGYGSSPVEDVARQLLDAAALFTRVLDRIAADDWDRTVLYNYPTLQERSLRWVAVHTVHEVRHHLDDVHRGSAPS